jgi:beta-mannosidase
LKLDGTELYKTRSAATVDTKGSLVLFRDSLNKVRRGTEKNNCLIYVSFASYDQKIVSSNIFYFCAPKDLLLQKPVIESSISKDGNKVIVTIGTNVPAKNVFVTMEGAELISGSSDNYFDLLPNDKKVLVFYSDKSEEELKKLLRVTTLRDTY